MISAFGRPAVCAILDPAVGLPQLTLWQKGQLPRPTTLTWMTCVEAWHLFSSFWPLHLVGGLEGWFQYSIPDDGRCVEAPSKSLPTRNFMGLNGGILWWSFDSNCPCTFPKIFVANKFDRNFFVGKIFLQQFFWKNFLLEKVFVGKTN